MSIVKDPLGERMKAYEKEFTSHKLDSTKPVIVRLDGKAFHSYTRGLDKPFDADLLLAFDKTIEDLNKHIHFDLAYHQSDEITLVFLPKLENSELIFSGKVSKINSVLSSMVSVFFNRAMEISKLAFFDCRCFNVPDLDEATNAVYWRMQDAFRNSVSMVAQANYSHKELYKKSCKEMQEMLGDEWTNLDLSLKQGSLWKHTLTTYKIGEENNLPEKHDALTSGLDTYIRKLLRPINYTGLVKDLTHDQRKELFFL